MRYSVLVISMALAAMPAAPAMAQVGLYFNTPGLSIGVNIPTYPDFAQVPDYPVYYTPGLAHNLFYYDGMYWLLEGDDWYASTWYNGPWQNVESQGVPLFVLRVPVRYYRSPPPYFRGWQGDAPPRWDEHWGPGWSQHHRGWDQWDRRDAPRPAPLPAYQGQYSGTRYPRAEQQLVIRQQHDKYEPRDAAVRQRLQPVAQPAPARAPAPQAAAPRQPDQQHVQRDQQQKHQRQAPQEEQTQQEQQQKQQGQQPARPEQQQKQQQQSQENKARYPEQEQHAVGREQERPAAPAREPAKEAKPARERNKADQGNEDDRK